MVNAWFLVRCSGFKAGKCTIYPMDVFLLVNMSHEWCHKRHLHYGHSLKVPLSNNMTWLDHIYINIHWYMTSKAICHFWQTKPTGSLSGYLGLVICISNHSLGNLTIYTMCVKMLLHLNYYLSTFLSFFIIHYFKCSVLDLWKCFFNLSQTHKIPA